MIITHTTSDAYFSGCFGHWEVSKMSTPLNFVSPSQGRRRLDTSCREKTPSSDRSPSFPLRYATDRPELPVKVPFLPEKKKSVSKKLVSPSFHLSKTTYFILYSICIKKLRYLLAKDLNLLCEKESRRHGR